ncbi:MAG: hypothetical protein LBP26_06485 [Clostridiales bacterium]|jgi:hypothetical protein|nr:hypothetical protein [Clostridiales bacterium]
MFYAASPLLFIIIPLALVQYAAALFCLVKLVLLDLPPRRFWPWNLFILLALFVGPAAFLICYFRFRQKVFPPRPDFSENSDSVDSVAPTDNAADGSAPTETAAPNSSDNKTAD